MIAAGNSDPGYTRLNSSSEKPDGKKRALLRAAAIIHADKPLPKY
jgi:hypothetical protein